MLKKKSFCQRVHLVLKYLCNFRGSYFSHRIKERLFEKMCLKGLFHRIYKMFLVTAISLPHGQL